MNDTTAAPPAIGLEPLFSLEPEPLPSEKLKRPLNFVSWLAIATADVRGNG